MLEHVWENKNPLNRSLSRAFVPDVIQYASVHLDPALVSRFNVVTFRPTVQEWLLWETD